MDIQRIMEIINSNQQIGVLDHIRQLAQQPRLQLSDELLGSGLDDRQIRLPQQDARYYQQQHGRPVVMPIQIRKDTRFQRTDNDFGGENSYYGRPQPRRSKKAPKLAPTYNVGGDSLLKMLANGFGSSNFF